MDPRRRRPDDDPASHVGFLDEAEGARPARKRRTKPGDDAALDLDSVW